MKKTKKSSDQLNAEGLIDLALIFAQRNCNEFFKMNLLQETTFKHKHLDNLVQNYIYKKKVSIE
tara:strand:+ start:402 stop:593 length:192 start_codon:yes stop_codon:yes gene_type:complete